MRREPTGDTTPHHEPRATLAKVVHPHTCRYGSPGKSLHLEPTIETNPTLSSTMGGWEHQEGWGKIDGSILDPTPTRRSQVGWLPQRMKRDPRKRTFRKLRPLFHPSIARRSLSPRRTGGGMGSRSTLKPRLESLDPCTTT